MNLRVEGPFIHFTIPILGGIRITQTTVSSLIVTIFLCSGFVLLGRNLKKHPDGMQVLVEKGVMMLVSMVESSMGAHNTHWTPFIGAIFLSSLFGSLIGLTGFFRSSTADLSCTIVWALMVSVTIWYNGIKRNGFFGWLRGFTTPIPVMTPMNLISEIAQPISMAFRHFGNIAGGGVITSLLYTALGLASNAVTELLTSSGWLLSGLLLGLGAAGLYFWRTRGGTALRIIPIVFLGLGVCGLLELAGVLTDVPILSWGIPAVLSVYFDLFSGFVQAYVFTLLTMIYIAASLPSPEAHREP